MEINEEHGVSEQYIKSNKLYTIICSNINKIKQIHLLHYFIVINILMYSELCPYKYLHSLCTLYKYNSSPTVTSYDMIAHNLQSKIIKRSIKTTLNN